MTDIDFDELDKAVNSLMGKAVSTDPDDAVQEKNLTISSTLKPGEKPQYDKLVEVAKGIGSETLLIDDEHTVMGDSKLPTEELAIAELDVIQSNQIGADVIAPPQRSAIPLGRRPNGGRAMDIVRSTSIGRPAPAVVSYSAPDSTPPQEATVREPEIVHAEVLPPVETTENTEPPRLTPFLPDTKVEKRPLGSGSSSDAATPSGAVASPFSDDAKPAEGFSTEPVADDTAEDTYGRADNKSQQDSQKPLEATNFEEKLSPEEQKLHEIESTEAAADAPTAESVRAVESGDTEKLSSGSISQQYQTKQAESTEAAGAIYDVKDYHQALGHPAKQKSGWGIIVLILIIIVAFALIGAATYFILGAGL